MTTQKLKLNKAAKLQTWFRKKRWSFDQYYKIYFTLYKNHAFEINYITVIKSRSFEFARDLLLLKLKETEPDLKVKNIRGYMFHKDYCFSRSSIESENKITMEDWENIRSCAYPNQNNFLFKCKISEINCSEILQRNKIKLENLHHHE